LQDETFFFGRGNFEKEINFSINVNYKKRRKQNKKMSKRAFFFDDYKDVKLSKKNKPQEQYDQVPYWLLFLLTLATLIGLLAVGLTLNNRLVAQSSQIKTLKMDTMHLQTDVVSLTMTQNLPFATRIIQNGTVSLGFPRIAGIAVVSTADFLDYVTLEYSLQEILLTSTGVPVTMLKISETPRPIVFNGYSPLPTQPRDNDLRMQLALFSPGINLLDVLTQNFELFPYSSRTASKILLEPNCVFSTECQPESSLSPFFGSSFPTFNSVNLFSNNNAQPGVAVMEFIWGQNTYASIPAQYDFIGTTVSFNSTIEMQMPVL